MTALNVHSKPYPTNHIANNTTSLMIPDYVEDSE